MNRPRVIGRPPRRVSQDERRSPGLQLIAAMMAERGLSGDPRDYVILSGWNRIQDGDAVFRVRAHLPERVESGAHVWVRSSSSSPDLLSAIVLEDRGEGLWVEPVDGPSRFLVPREDARVTPVPLRPALVHKRRLWEYLGPQESRRFWKGGRIVYDPARYRGAPPEESGPDASPEPAS